MSQQETALGPEWCIEGQYTEGVLDSYDIAPKELASASGVHESTLSRFFNDRKPIKDKTLLKIGISIGRLAEQRDAKRKNQQAQSAAGR